MPNKTIYTPVFTTHMERDKKNVLVTEVTKWESDNGNTGYTVALKKAFWSPKDNKWVMMHRENVNIRPTEMSGVKEMFDKAEAFIKANPVESKTPGASDPTSAFSPENVSRQERKADAKTGAAGGSADPF